jgi:hypothetical protein
MARTREDFIEVGMKSSVREVGTDINEAGHGLKELRRYIGAQV